MIVTAATAKPGLLPSDRNATRRSREVIEPCRGLLVAAFVFSQLQGAELAAGAFVGFLRSQTLCDQLGAPCIQMELELGVHSPFPTAPPEPSEPFHMQLLHSACSSTSEMASQSRFHPAVSVSSCCFSDFVRL